MLFNCYEMKGPSSLKGLVSVIKPQKECNIKFQLYSLVSKCNYQDFMRVYIYRTRREACVRLASCMNIKCNFKLLFRGNAFLLDVFTLNMFRY